jgi:hypothetical protein
MMNARLGFPTIKRNKEKYKPEVSKTYKQSKKKEHQRYIVVIKERESGNIIRTASYNSNRAYENGLVKLQLKAIIDQNDLYVYQMKNDLLRKINIIQFEDIEDTLELLESIQRIR